MESGMTTRIGSMNRHFVLTAFVGFAVVGLARAAQPDQKMLAESKRIVSKYKTRMEQPPRRVPRCCRWPLVG